MYQGINLKVLKMKEMKKGLDGHFFHDEYDGDEPDFCNNLTSTPHLSEYVGDITRKSKQVKRKNKYDEDSLISDEASKISERAKVKRKKIRHAHQSRTVHDSDDSDNEESSMLRSENPNNFPSYLANMSSDIYESSVSDRESFDENPKKQSSENFHENIEPSEYSSDYDESDKFFMDKKKQLVDELKSTSPETRIARQKSKNYTVTSLHSRNMVIVLLNHPATLTLYKYVSVEVLSGSASICGSEIHADSSPIKVFSSERTGLICLKTESFEQVWIKKTFYNLRRKLWKVTENKKIAHNILSKFGNSTVVVVITGCTFPPSLQFLELYFPIELQFKLMQKKKMCYQIPNEYVTAIEFGPDAESLADEIISAIRRSKISANVGPIILIYGPKNAGKSSLLQFLVNKALSVFPSIYYLDADPGQTEFTPPGVVSLTKVNKPVIGPAFCHQTKPISMIFTGAISADSSPNMYVKSICKLISTFKAKYCYEALFVNTMGWIKGIGLECLEEIAKAAQPTILGEVIVENDECAFDYKTYVHGKVKYFPLSSPTANSFPGLAGYETRNLSLLSYFGKCQVPYYRPTYINEFRPFCVSWDKIPIYIFGKKTPPYRIVEAVNASVVALCHVPEKYVLMSNIPNFPKTLQDEPLNECLGFGIVRAIDEAKHLLYIVTPLQLNDLQNVNAIIRGNVELPSSVFVKQPIYDIPLPFTDDSMVCVTNSIKTLRRKIPGRYQQ